MARLSHWKVGKWDEDREWDICSLHISSTAVASRSHFLLLSGVEEMQLYLRDKFYYEKKQKKKRKVSVSKFNPTQLNPPPASVLIPNNNICQTNYFYYPYRSHSDFYPFCCFSLERRKVSFFKTDSARLVIVMSGLEGMEEIIKRESDGILCNNRNLKLVWSDLLR